MYFLLAICLAFSLLLILNILVSVSASVVWRVLEPAAKRASARRRAQIIFALRTFPIGAATLFVLAFLLPAYVLFEPHSTEETVSYKLALITLASLTGIAIAAFRVARTWVVTRRLMANWLEYSEPIELEDVSVPVYRLEHPFPVIAVVGIMRPRMFVAAQIFDSLSREEFSAAIAHEYGHLSGHDNFKRTFMRVCRDMLLLPFGRELDRAWSANTESAADEYAAGVGGDSMAVHLASALIKIARIVPGGTSPAMPLASFLIDGRDGNLRDRIKRLLELSDDSSGVKIAKSRTHPLWVYPMVLAPVVLFFATNKDLLLSIHHAYENVVHLLQ